MSKSSKNGKVPKMTEEQYAEYVMAMKDETPVKGIGSLRRATMELRTSIPVPAKRNKFSHEYPTAGNVPAAADRGGVPVLFGSNRRRGVMSAPNRAVPGRQKTDFEGRFVIF